MRIREIRDGDLAAIHAINEAGTPGVHSEPADALAAITRMCRIALLVESERDGEILGFCQVLPPRTTYASVNYEWFSSRYDDFVYLDRVAVAPAHRNRGIGGLLYDEVERRVSAHGSGQEPSSSGVWGRSPHRKAAWFLLEVNLRPRNDGSLRFHARRGFVEVGQQETDYGALVSMMAKRL